MPAMEEYPLPGYWRFMYIFFTSTDFEKKEKNIFPGDLKQLNINRKRKTFFE